MIVELSKEELQAIIMLNRAGIDFLENIDTEKLHNIMDKLETSVSRN